MLKLSYRRVGTVSLLALMILGMSGIPALANHGPAHENQGKGRGVSTSTGGGESTSTGGTESTSTGGTGTSAVNQQCPAGMTKVDSASGSVDLEGVQLSWSGTTASVTVEEGYTLVLCLKFATQTRTFSLSGPESGEFGTGDKYDISHIAYSVGVAPAGGVDSSDESTETTTEEGNGSTTDESSDGDEGSDGSGGGASVQAAEESSTGTLSITKVTDDPTDDKFHFFGPVAETEFTISAGESWVTVLDANSYTVQEATHEGWALVGLTCNDPTGDTVVDLASGLVSVKLAPGETVSCTFLNDPVQVMGIQTTSEDTSGSEETSVAADTLPFTGFEAREMLTLGLIVLAAGAGVLALTRKEDPSPIA